jgi:NodT family efflux transporter outer membrane factor (OMF) lipoprotein
LLSAQGELATDYFSVRQADAESALLQATIVGYQRALTITQNRYDAGIAPKTDLLQAQTQLANAQAELIGLTRTRAQFEHAMAVLTGKAPADFALAVAPWRATLPPIPVGVPSTLLQRRPDIAAAERRVASANAQIGIAQAAYYPSLNLSASGGSSASRVADLFAASTSIWSLGLSSAQVLFDAGATRERVNAARAGQEQAAARYRQTVLEAFASVEDQLNATTVLTQQQSLREQASRAADETEAQALNRYRAGQISYTEVVTAQASALSARRALVQLAASRQVTAVALIQALGGGWQQ